MIQQLFLAKIQIKIKKKKQKDENHKKEESFNLNINKELDEIINKKNNEINDNL